ncbi:SOS response-associated peptidase [Aeoliella sp.]|uniref:SOS response-associated peptidase n=1 Tax=Aeoliella sp. TaxID=2795800 RepID=UPI003CCBE13E
MCGRYVLGPATDNYWVDLRGFLDTLGVRYNVAPTSTVGILRHGSDGREAAAVRWGLIPSWAKDTKIAYSTINARSESVAEKPAFRAAFKRRRCMVFADGYYEWTGPKGDKQPHYIQLAGGEPMLFFGLWESWKGPPGEPLDEPLETCTIITTSANEQLAEIHDRMPSIAACDAEEIDLWLDPEFEDAEHLKSLLGPSDLEFTTTKVSRYVNKVGNEGAECLEPMDEDS